MSYLLTGNDANQPFAILVESIASNLLMKHPAPICLEVDIDMDLRVNFDAASLSQLIDSLVRQALVEMPSGGELTITACESPTGVELEIADTGSDVEMRACKLPMVAAAMAAELVWQNCPQGGAAVTARLPRYRQSQRRAA
ncbi:ATP-binding protein [Allorhodopirellula heiligendammensis]|uniref:Histidine kinase/HSP90-like ATPase domain-containing protein n=1 Tax=Allorhodopirellula heiligendammensis TaxID=2714739 RepID=A0A5C6BGV9_9BACT|nr:ATP-binding protein [Allorhodopirellula heiligendammensis]TWU10731.1 hypothetical protein Poly21_46370 [Allorhodopirellula heiligendammensis]|tara:strand:+ start:496 stop:918 length:423 start_codon:yes stop_codon:yes gene_type:complete